MHTLYIGYITSNDIIHIIQERKINNMSIARQRFEENLLPALSKYCEGDISFVSYVPIDESLSLPEEYCFDGVRVHQIGINRKKPSSWKKAMRDFSCYLNSLGENKLRNMNVVMYEVNPVFLIPLLRIKRKYNIHLVSIVAELSSLRRSKRLKYRIRNAVFSFYEKKFDGFVLLTESMSEVLHCQSKPHIVVEGIAPAIFGEPNVHKPNIVMYAGGLAEDNNIRLLVDCCEQIEELHELWICGVGPDQDYVKEASIRNGKIHYLGFLDNDTVRKLETQAKVLINIRNPEAKITKYSFPSKTLEYLASGTLTITSKLQGIPSEYYDYIIPVDAISKEEVTKVIEATLKMDESTYYQKCVDGQRFVSETKNSDIQGKRIVQFINDYFNMEK